MKALSRKARYALQALAVFSRSGSDGLLTASEVAARSSSPTKFLEAILQRLTRAGILASKKGKGGGYTLLSPAHAISVGQVIRAIDGAIDPLPCLRETAPEQCDDCPGALTTCGARFVMARIRDAVAVVLDGTTLADFARPTTDVRRTSRMVFNP
jgi:Rrf2 family protein